MYLTYLSSIRNLKAFESIHSFGLERITLILKRWFFYISVNCLVSQFLSRQNFCIVESVMPSSHFTLCCPLLLPPPIPPCIRVFSNESLFTWGGQSTGVSALASFLPKKSWADLLQNGMVGSPCSPRDSQESSPTPQFKSISSLALSFLYNPTFTSIHDHWKNHSLD